MPIKKYTHVATGRVIQQGEAFALGEGDDLIRYPSNWLEFALPEDLANHGIALELLPDPPPPPAPDPEPPAEITKADVKAEAQRRIYDRYPQWKQANMTARSTELFRIQSGFMRNSQGGFEAVRALSPDELAEEIAIKQAWDWIKAVREASNALENTTPIPADYMADSRWPA
jgi:hypothetical protein